MNRLLSFNPEPFESEFAFGGAMELRDFKKHRIEKPCGCGHAAAESLSAFVIDPEVGPVAPAPRPTLRRTTPAIPRTPSSRPPFDRQAFRRRAVEIAHQELVRWGDGVIRVDGGQPPVPVAPSPTPRLRGRESIPPGATLYVEIDLKITDRAGIAAPPVTGVFIPEGYQPGAAVDLVLYLHGFKADAIKRDAIDQYWNSLRFPYGALREGVNASGRNVVLVAPTLGSGSEARSLLKPGGLDAFLSQVLAALRAYAPHSSAGVAPALGNLIFACHSGGGWPMRQLAGGKDRVLGQLRECWGFDCTYNRGDDAFWGGWARARPNAKIYIYYIAGSQTAPLAESLRNMRVPNVIVQTSRDRRHNYVPIAHWKERLQGAGFPFRQATRH